MAASPLGSNVAFCDMPKLERGIASPCRVPWFKILFWLWGDQSNERALVELQKPVYSPCPSRAANGSGL